jgi:hypothetical protein
MPVVPFQEQGRRNGRHPVTTPQKANAVPIAIAASLAALAWVAPVGSQPTPAPADRLPASAADPRVQAVEQKRVMVERILRGSPVATRIAGGASDEARKLLATAKDLHDQAAGHLAAGRAAAADALLNDAMSQIGRARSLVPDPAAAAGEERTRHQKLLESIGALEHSYRANVARQSAHGAKETTADRERESAEKLVADARALAGADRYAEANALLDRALATMLRDFNVHLGGQALIYSRAFPRAQDEYAFELERNRSYESLVPLAITEYRPGKDALALIERYVEENRLLRERAERLAASNNMKSAVKNLQEATDALQRALQAAGLAVPQSTVHQ